MPIIVPVVIAAGIGVWALMIYLLPPCDWSMLWKDME